ncbi:MAG TPA: hypothetical protein VIM75_06020 [Ohtaekwangia sp.]|uniref:hypothetical protein n=1 Tax=Ohtaekwangia sp. TaxID=2066019 RepID=UPI002F9583C2
MYRGRNLPQRALLTIPLLIILSLAACHKPMHLSNDGYSWEEAPPLVLRTSLNDSLSAKALQQLQLTNTPGVQVKYNNSTYVNYFEYKADHELLLRTIASLPFSRYAMRADTVCYRIPMKDLALIRKGISDTEYEASSFFWDADANTFDIYECYKAPMKHTLLMSRNSTTVLHRIEFVG